MKNRTVYGRNLTFCGIMTAFMCVLGILANVMHFNTLFFLAVTSLIMCVVTQKTGIRYAICTSLATSILLFVFTWNKIIALEYFLFFGTYPVIKYIIESKIRKDNVEKTAKAIFFAFDSAAIVFAAEFVLGGVSFWGDWYSGGIMNVICFVAVALLEAVYDFMLSYFVYLFNKKFNGRLFK